MGKCVDFPGYQVVVRDNLTTVVKKGYTRSFQNFRIPEVSDSKDTQSPHHGRARLISFPLSENPEERALVRRYVRGGVLGRFLKGKYLNWGKPRPLKELEASEFARSRGIPTPEILATAVERSSPLFYKGAIAVREISPSEDLQTVLLRTDQSSASGAPVEKGKIAASLGRLIAKMHKAGIYHADLHLKNILLSGKGADGEIYLLDLDAARIYNPLSDFRKCMNLLRLLRSAEKVNDRLMGKRRKANGEREILRFAQNDKEMDSRFRGNDIGGACGNDRSQAGSDEKLNGPAITKTDMLRFLQAYAEEGGWPVEVLTGKLLRMLPFWRMKWKLSDILGV
jgi:tRNA A-37 threonylcarbamoyl transferase component Bud32